MDQVTQVIFDLAEGLVLGQIDKAFGQVTQRLIGLGAQLAEESLDTGFTVFRGLQRG